MVFRSTLRNFSPNRFPTKAKIENGIVTLETQAKHQSFYFALS